MFDQTEHLTSYGTINPPTPPLEYPQDDEDSDDVLPASSAETTLPGTLHRSLSSRQVQMIAIAGTIGTGLFLGTGRALAQGGPATMLICYSVIGFVVYITLLLLGEMATQYPVAGEFFNSVTLSYTRTLRRENTAVAVSPVTISFIILDTSVFGVLTSHIGSFNIYTTRFFSPAYGFALTWNYWSNAAISVASDLTAVQLVLDFWNIPNGWAFSLALWVFILSVNALHVKAYGELGGTEYWLASLKVVAIVVFILLGTLVNVGSNREHHFIGFENWTIHGAPFVGGLGGFAHVFVTASFAYGGTESLSITAGETKNPNRNMPRVVKFVFWRILLFYLISILLIGLNVPWDYPNLSNESTTTSPFTIVFRRFGSPAAASFMNTVILSSVISAGNHALFAGTRVLYGLAQVSQAPSLFLWTTRKGVPLPAMLLTSSVSVLCFGSSFIGSGRLWAWLQNLVGVSNQIAWLSIGIASWRFRAAWKMQGRPLSEMKFRARWTWPWGPPFVIAAMVAIILIQGWPSVIPRFSAVDFLSFYIELLVMALMYFLWLVAHRVLRSSRPPPLATQQPTSSTTPAASATRPLFFDFVDLSRVDLYHDEHEDEPFDKHEDEDEVRARRLRGLAGWAWALYYYIVA